jgi:pyrimidine-nucleoside phosphorylase
MNTARFIRDKRDGKSHDITELKTFLISYLNNKIKDYQMSAWLMAAFLNGLDTDETKCLTQTMLDSGQKMDFSDIIKPKVDKHSTGGVGDKLSLIIAPLAAVCGLTIPMISGRGLGHTGGTLDKMESVPGFNVKLSSEQFDSILREHDLAMAGQTAEIAPLDKKLYALRDVTATVEYIPFIAASIMSKKLSEDLDALVLDVKWGSGAFMDTEEQAIELAKALVEIGERFNVNTVALVTDMNQPLGNSIGNWLEMKEAMEILSGKGPEDAKSLSISITASMLVAAGLNESYEKALDKVNAALNSGEAKEKWLEVAKAQGADITYLSDLNKMPKSKFSLPVYSTKSGYLNSFKCREIGFLANDLGAGRYTKEDEIEPLAGIILHAKVGDYVEQGGLLATLYANDETKLTKKDLIYRDLITFSEEMVTEPKLIRYKVDKNGVQEL